MPQTFYVATLVDCSILAQGMHYAQTPLDQRHLSSRERRFRLTVQEPFYACDGPLYLAGYAGIHRFSACMNGVERVKSGIEGEACMRPQDAIWQREHPVLDSPGLPTEPELRSRLLHQEGGIRVVWDSQRVGNSLLQFTLLLKPLGCQNVDVWQQIWLP